MNEIWPNADEKASFFSNGNAYVKEDKMVASHWINLPFHYRLDAATCFEEAALGAASESPGWTCRVVRLKDW